MYSDLLLIFTRYAEPGKVKTRLIPALGAVGAANLHYNLTAYSLQIARSFGIASNTEVLVFFDGPQIQQMQQMFGAQFKYQPQAAGDLGYRMFAAFADSLRRGRNRVVLIGSDCPGISGEILSKAFTILRNHDLVLGPATDGGYYLIGLTALYPELFQDIPWGTGEVLAATQAKARRLGLKTALLEPLTDIDRPEDLPVWEEISRRVEHE